MNSKRSGIRNKNVNSKKFTPISKKSFDIEHTCMRFEKIQDMAMQIMKTRGSSVICVDAVTSVGKSTTLLTELCRLLRFDHVRFEKRQSMRIRNKECGLHEVWHLRQQYQYKKMIILSNNNSLAESLMNYNGRQLQEEGLVAFVTGEKKIADETMPLKDALIIYMNPQVFYMKLREGQVGLFKESLVIFDEFHELTRFQHASFAALFMPGVLRGLRTDRSIAMEFRITAVQLSASAAILNEKFYRNHFNSVKGLKWEGVAGHYQFYLRGTVHAGLVPKEEHYLDDVDKLLNFKELFTKSTLNLIQEYRKKVSKAVETRRNFENLVLPRFVVEKIALTILSRTFLDEGVDGDALVFLNTRKDCEAAKLRFLELCEEEEKLGRCEVIDGVKLANAVEEYRTLLPSEADESTEIPKFIDEWCVGEGYDFRCNNGSTAMVVLVSCRDTRAQINLSTCEHLPMKLRKVVFSTAIYETGLTMPNMVCLINNETSVYPDLDHGVHFVDVRGRLSPVASFLQRKGRAGRGCHTKSRLGWNTVQRIYHLIPMSLHELRQSEFQFLSPEVSRAFPMELARSLRCNPDLNLERIGYFFSMNFGVCSVWDQFQYVSFKKAFEITKDETSIFPFFKIYDQFLLMFVNDVISDLQDNSEEKWEECIADICSSNQKLKVIKGRESTLDSQVKEENRLKIWRGLKKKAEKVTFQKKCEEYAEKKFGGGSKEWILF